MAFILKETSIDVGRTRFGYSGILKELLELASTHRKFINLSMCDPPFFGHTLDSFILDQIDKLPISRYSNYPSWNGDLDLRHALSNRIQEISEVSVPTNNIVLTYGVSEAFPIAFDALFRDQPGSMAIPDPSYLPLISQASRFSKIWFYRCCEKDGWNPDIDDLVKSLEKHNDTRAITIITPNSPTGAVYSEAILKEIVNVAGQYELVLITDEIYDSLSFDHFSSVLRLSAEVPVIYLNGFSKVYRLPGFRLGYLAWHDPCDTLPSFWEGVMHLCKTRFGVTTLAQQIAKLALQEPLDALKAYVETVHDRMVFLAEQLKSIQDVSVVPAQGSTYLFPKIKISDEQVAKHMIKKYGVLVTPGSMYGPTVAPGPV